jgi:indole-3-glycerol phosphate synthase
MTLAFAAALTASPSPLIAEIKPRSPKAGTLMDPQRAAEVARAYAAAGAPCLSVTTGRWHGGSLDMVAEMAAATGLPVLRKDFLTTRRHLSDTREAGASAALVTCALLRRSDVARLAAEALDLGLTPFVEAASADEIDGLDLPAGSILAVNNRNIREQETDDGGIGRSLDLLRLARATHRGQVVSASGMLAPADVAAVRAAGFDGVLVGTALLGGSGGIEETTRRFLRAARLPAGAAASGR